MTVFGLQLGCCGCGVAVIVFKTVVVTAAFVTVLVAAVPLCRITLFSVLVVFRVCVITVVRGTTTVVFRVSIVVCDTTAVRATATVVLIVTVFVDMLVAIL